MILGKSAIRTALGNGEIRLLDDQGNTLQEWEAMRQWGIQCSLDGTFDRYAEKDPIALQPASIDLHLGNEWLVPKPNEGIRIDIPDRGPNGPRVRVLTQQGTDPSKPIEYASTVSDSFWIPANGFVLVRTREVVELSESLTSFVEGRSSVGRSGLFVQNAGWVDPAFRGSVTLELYNALPNPYRVHAGMRACQLVFVRVEGSTEGGYRGGKYQGQVATTGSLLHKDFAA